MINYNLWVRDAKLWMYSINDKLQLVCEREGEKERKNKVQLDQNKELEKERKEELQLDQSKGEKDILTSSKANIGP